MREAVSDLGEEWDVFEEMPDGDDDHWGIVRAHTKQGALQFATAAFADPKGRGGRIYVTPRRMNDG